MFFFLSQRERRNDTSNMAVMEVGLPSGYVADVDALPSVLQIPKVKRVETQLQDTGVVIYFDRVSLVYVLNMILCVYIFMFNFL